MLKIGAFSKLSRVPVKTLPAETMATTVHRGSYTEFSAAYTAVLGWIQANGYHVSGPNREVF